MAREHERSTYLTEVTLESASGKRHARVSDVSLGGCFVDTLTKVRAGEEVLMTGNLSNGDHLKIKGTVAYVMDGFGFGVAFTELDNGSQEALKRIIGSA
jgi:Tfp pilus assembly protein PilZ